MKLPDPPRRLRAACAALAFAGLALPLLAGAADDGRAASAPASRVRPGADTPAVRLLLVGALRGTLEPCGCAGGQLGGLARIKTRLDIEMQRDPGAVTILAGGLARGGSEVETIRGEIAASALLHVPVAAVGLGDEDLASGAEATQLRAQLMKNIPMPERPTVVHAHVVTNREATEPVVARARIDARGVDGAPCTVSVLSLAGRRAGNGAEEIGAADLAAARKALEGAPADGLCIAVVHATRETVRRVADALPEIDVVVAALGTGSPDETAESRGGTVLLHPGEKGRHVVDLVVARRGGRTEVVSQRALLVESSLPPDESVHGVVESYRERLRDADVIARLAGTLPRPGSGYAGSETCKTCHPQAYQIWKKSKHSHGVESLLPRNGQHDPDCLKCHAVGWYNDEAAGFATGYMGEPTGRLAYVGCESCHGPARDHTKNPLASKPVKDVDCRKCHDAENSPLFDREVYWNEKKVKHGRL